MRDMRRAEAIRARFLAGESMGDIAPDFKITRERVRQILKKLGVRTEDGGCRLRALCRKAERRAAIDARRDERMRKIFGCDYETVVLLNGGSAWSDPRGFAWRYFEHKRNTEARGIAWQITLPQWCRVWVESGHWEERGRTRDSYVMARRGDLGPYAPWNVYITTSVQNIKDGYAFRRARKNRGGDSRVAA